MGSTQSHLFHFIQAHSFWIDANAARNVIYRRNHNFEIIIMTHSNNIKKMVVDSIDLHILR